MEYAKLGNSDLRVSRICLGCMGFGDPSIGQHSWTIGEEPTREIIHRSLDLGVNFFDTAIAYQLGTSEQYVGRTLRDMAKRDDVVVATKFLPRTDEEIQQGIGGRQHVLNNIDLSLQHLGMDYVDLYIYHIWDYKTPAEEILEGMNEAVRQGKARYIGIANVYAYQLAKMNALAEKHGWSLSANNCATATRRLRKSATNSTSPTYPSSASLSGSTLACHQQNIGSRT